MLPNCILDNKMQYKSEYRRSIEEYKPAISVRRKIPFYWILAGIRILLCLIPQTGYIHPDEYFQSIEVISGDQFDIDIFKPWEFNATFPIRTSFIPQLIVGLPYGLLKRLSPYSFYYLGVTLRTPYFLVMFPRLVMCCLSFVADYCLYKMCCLYGQNYKVRLITFASSYVMLTFGTRTFSNTVELILSALLLYYTSECMAYSEKVVVQSDLLYDKYSKAKPGAERVKYYKLRASLPSHSLNHCFKLATITVIGIFNRPTFVAFALPPIFFWLQRGLGSKSVSFVDFHTRIFTFMAFGVPTVLFFILADSFYFGYLTLGEIVNLDIGINNFVVTPLNFLKYNVNGKNLEHHGLHPRCLHFLINVPLLFNVLGIIGLRAFAKISLSGLKGRWLDMPRIQSIVGLMTASFVIPIALLSFFPHQEPRFIIPVIIPLVFLHAPSISQVPNVDTVSRIDDNSPPRPSSQKPKLTKLQFLWYACNILLCFFYGFAHQGGVLPLTSHIAAELKAKPELTHVHLFTSYTYSIPTALLQLRNTRKTYISSGNQRFKLTKDFFLYEQGSKNTSDVYNAIVRRVKECDRKFIEKRIPYRIYYALPVSAVDEFIEYSLQNSSYPFKYKPVKTFYPHVSTERLPSFNKIADMVTFHDLDVYTTKTLIDAVTNVSNLLQQFGLLLMRIESFTINHVVRS